MTPAQRQAHMLREAADACEDHANCELIYAETCKPSKVKGAKDRAIQLCGLTGELRVWADQLDPPNRPTPPSQSLPHEVAARFFAISGQTAGEPPNTDGERK